MGESCPDLLPDDQQMAFNDVLNKNNMRLDWQTGGITGENYRQRMGLRRREFYAQLGSAPLAALASLDII